MKLLPEPSNTSMEMVASALSAGAEDITDVCKKLETTIDVCAKFKEYYLSTKTNQKESGN
jgi:hypothetical protein